MNVPLPMPLQVAVVPKKITTRIREVARLHVRENAEPRFVDITPFEFCSAQNCHHNVRQTIDRFGGGQQGGWKVNHVPGEFYEFVAHSVWIREDDAWLDVTPEPGLIRHVFVPDNSVDYEGARPVATRFFADASTDVCIRNVERMNTLAEQALAFLAVDDAPSGTAAHAELSQIVVECLQQSAQRGWTS